MKRTDVLRAAMAGVDAYYKERGIFQDKFGFGASPALMVIYKEHASAFAGTALVGHLLGRRVDTLLITGCSTSACVRATATDAKSNEMKPIVIREAVQDRSEVLHEFTLFDLQARFADVVRLEEAMRYLQER